MGKDLYLEKFCAELRRETDAEDVEHADGSVTIYLGTFKAYGDGYTENLYLYNDGRTRYDVVRRGRTDMTENYIPYDLKDAAKVARRIMAAFTRFRGVVVLRVDYN